MIYVDRSDRGFNNLIKVFAGLMLLHCILMYFDIVLAVELLYGPMHLAMFRISKQKEPKRTLLIQLLPFVLLTLLYCALEYSRYADATWSDTLLLYHPIHLICSIVSTMGYGIYLWTIRTDSNADFKQKQLRLVMQLASIAMLIGIFLILFFLSMASVNTIQKDIIGFDPLQIVVGLMLLSVLVVISYLRADKIAKLNSDSERVLKTIEIDKASTQVYTMDQDVLEGYSLQVEKYMNAEKVYLRSGLSMDDLSQETGIARHHLSQVFNSFFGKSFYQYIAEKRIEEAVNRIKEDRHIKLETLAYDCGFNSKSSFNKYFKDYVGEPPSEYRLSMQMIQEE